MAFDLEQYHKQYYQDHAEILKQRSRQWEKDNPERARQNHIRYYQDNAEIIKQRAKLNSAPIRIMQRISVFTYYGMKCELCNETRLGALNIDHIDGNGRQHRKTFNGDINRLLYNQYSRTGIWPSGYRTLCANHNWIEYLNSRPPLSQSRKSIKAREKSVQVKLGILEVLGGPVCIICGCTDLNVLEVHHPNNDGGVHRQEISPNNHFYFDLMKSNNFSRLMVVTCKSCNMMLSRI